MKDHTTYHMFWFQAYELASMAPRRIAMREKHSQKKE